MPGTRVADRVCVGGVEREPEARPSDEDGDLLASGCEAKKRPIDGHGLGRAVLVACDEVRTPGIEVRHGLREPFECREQTRALLVQRAQPVQPCRRNYTADELVIGDRRIV
jgi:hypothetical protein